MHLADQRTYTTDYPQTNIVLATAISVLDNAKPIEDLVNLIKQYLTKGQDALLNVALNLSPSFNVSKIIWQALNQAMIEATKAYLFATPIVIVTGSRSRLELNPKFDLEQIKSIYSEVLGTSIDQVEVNAKLFSFDDLNKFTPSQIYNYEATYNKLQQLSLDPNLKQTIVANAQKIDLHFVVGLIKDVEIDQSKISQFNHAIMQCVINGFKLDPLSKDVTIFPIPFGIHPLYLALANGQYYMQEVMLNLFLSEGIRNINMQGKSPCVKLSSLSDEIKLELFAQDNPNLKTVMPFPLRKFDDFNQILESITQIIQSMKAQLIYG